MSANFLLTIIYVLSLSTLGVILPLFLAQAFINFFSKNNYSLFENYIVGLLTLTLPVFIYLILGNSVFSFYLSFFVISILSLKNLKKIDALVKINSSIIFIWILYVTFGVISLSGDNISLYDITAASIQEHFSLPIDNLIQYQTVRYITESIDPVSVPPVPSWSFGDRGPLSGIIISSYFLLLGFREVSPWLGSTGVTYLVFETLMAVLNSLFLIPFLAILNINKSYKVLGLILILSSPFIFVNTFFGWAKLFSASLLLYPLINICFKENLTKKHHIFNGILIGLSLLSHENTVFYLPAIFLLVLYIYRVKSFLIFLSSTLLIYLPWIIYKKVVGLSSLGVFICNALCLPVGESKSTLSLLSEYLSKNSLKDIILIRVENILYPINIFHYDWVDFFRAPSISRFIKSTAHLTFYQFIFGIGIILFLRFFYLLLFGKFNNKKNKYFLLVLISSIFVSGILSGCKLSTVNHIWAYPLIVGLSSYLIIRSKYQTIDYIMIVSQIVLNLSILFLFIFQKPLTYSYDNPIILASYKIFALVIIGFFLIYKIFKIDTRMINTMDVN